MLVFLGVSLASSWRSWRLAWLIVLLRSAPSKTSLGLKYLPMSPVYMGSSWRIAMRCVDRKFLLTPTPEVTATIGFCFAIACGRPWPALACKRSLNSPKRSSTAQ